MPESTELDPVVHGQLRLAVLSILVGAEEANFSYLREQVGATDGNLSVHLSKLEAAGYIAVKKHFVQKKPQSVYRITPRGRAAFLKYVAALKALLGKDLTGRR
jgi:DNA-binding MarR family transcriptional regulator